MSKQLFFMLLIFSLSGSLFAASSNTYDRKRSEPMGGYTTTSESDEKRHHTVDNDHIPEYEFEGWVYNCEKLAKDHRAAIQEGILDTLLDADIFLEQLERFERVEFDRLRNAPWCGKSPGMYVSDYTYTFTPFAQKLILPENACVSFHGDLHGDIHALNNYLVYLNDKKYLDGFKIIDDNFYMVFLGDYVDRGVYGVEVWYTILRLKNENPDRVIMIRGNHEDGDINITEAYGQGFNEELIIKLPGFDPERLYQVYNMLPVVLYLGCENNAVGQVNYIQCCHGGLEPGFNPQTFLQNSEKQSYCLVLGEDNRLNRFPGLDNLSPEIKNIVLGKASSSSIDSILSEPCSESTCLGHMWFDFIVDSCGIFEDDPTRGWSFGNRITQEILASHSTQKHKVCGVFRAHQHGDKKMMARIYGYDQVEHIDDIGVARLWPDENAEKIPRRLWQGIVCTFAVAPAIYGKIAPYVFDYDAFGLLKLHQEFEKWQLKSIRKHKNGALVSWC